MIDKSKTIYLDTNIFVRYLIGNDDNQAQQVAVLFPRIQSGEIKAYLLQSVFTEIVFVLSKFYQVPRYEIVIALTGLLQYKGLICEFKKALLLALDYYKNNNFHIVDCLLAAHVHLNHHDIFTFDEKLKKFIHSYKI